MGSQSAININEPQSAPTLRPLERAFAQTFIANAMMLVIGAATGILAARILGPLGRGELAAIFYYPMIIAQLGRLGIHEATAFEVSRRPQDEDELLRAGFGLALILGLPQVILGAPMVSFLLPADKIHLAGIIHWFMAFIILAQCNWVLLGADQGKFRFGRFNILQVLPSALYVAAMIGFWVMGRADVTTFTIACLGSYLLALLVRMAFCYRIIVARLPVWADMKRLLVRGFSLHVAHLGLIGMNGTDMLVLVSLLPSDQVGLYAAALALAWGQVALSNALSQVGFVKIAGETDRIAAKASLLNQFRIAQLISLALVGLFLLTSPYMMRYAFGQAFMPAVPVAFWLIGALGVAGLTNVLDTGFRALGRSWVAGLGYGVGVAVMIVGALCLVPTDGILAMAKVRFLSSVVVLLIYCVALWGLEEVPIKQLWGLKLNSIRFLWSRTVMLVRLRYSVAGPQS
jgi:O-antigen/teichoic acid export membrane protein